MNCARSARPSSSSATGSPICSVDGTSAASWVSRIRCSSCGIVTAAAVSDMYPLLTRTATGRPVATTSSVAPGRSSCARSWNSCAVTGRPWYYAAVSRWQRYWFDDGGRTSAAVVRIAIATSVLMTLQRLATLSTVHIPGPSELYRPVGIWMLFGHLVPPAGVVTALWIVAVGATVLMLVGLGSRAAT